MHLAFIHIARLMSQENVHDPRMGVEFVSNFNLLCSNENLVVKNQFFIQSCALTVLCNLY